jgi:hypothetical protein
MSGHIQRILTKKMTRKEFLVYLGMIMFTVIGISSRIKSLKSISSLNPTKIQKQPKTLSAKTSFGSGPYGV